MQLRNFLSALAVGTLAVLASAAPAHAATMSFTDASCADFSIVDQGAGNFSLSCNFHAMPICQLQASSTSPTVGTPLTLSAACTSQPFGWIFTGTATACGTGSSVCTDTQTSPGAVTYTVLGGNAAGRGPASSVTVNWQAGGAVPAGCTLTANPASLPANGGTVTLSTVCAGGGAATSYTWTGGSLAPTTTTAAVSTNVTATTTFTVKPANATGAGNTASVSVSVAGSTGGGGGGGGPDYCATLPNVIIVDVPWGGTVTSGGANGSFQANGTLVARFTVPAGFVSNVGFKGKVQAAEYGDPATYRQTSLSTKACDFRGVATGRYDTYTTDPTGTNNPLKFGFGNTAIVEFTVTGTALFTPQLQAGQTYYYNIRNWSPYANGGVGGISCTGGTGHCDMIVSHNTP